MSGLAPFWALGALVALFFAWILGYMQRGDARVRTERVAGLRERGPHELVAGEVNATRGTLEATREPLASPIAGTPCLYFAAEITREARPSVPGTPLETVHSEKHEAGAAIVAGDTRVAVELVGALVHPSPTDVVRELEWREGEWRPDEPVDAAWESAGFTAAERRYVEAQGVSVPGELPAGRLRLRYQQLPVGVARLVIGEVQADGIARTLRMASSTRFQLELMEQSLAAYQRAQAGAHRTMQVAARGFVALALGLAALAGLSYAGVLG